MSQQYYLIGKSAYNSAYFDLTNKNSKAATGQKFINLEKERLPNSKQYRTEKLLTPLNKIFK